MKNALQMICVDDETPEDEYKSLLQSAKKELSRDISIANMDLDSGSKKTGVVNSFIQRVSTNKENLNNLGVRPISQTTNNPPSTKYGTEAQPSSHYLMETIQEKAVLPL